MENKKISLQELTDIIALQAGSSKRFTESFLRQLVLVMQEYLEKDGMVKVKGLGTFKLLWNEPRKSVDVSTGQSIVLPGHYKVSFSPDAAVKERVNAPYAHLDTVMGGAEIISSVEETTTPFLEESLVEENQPMEPVQPVLDNTDPPVVENPQPQEDKKEEAVATPQPTLEKRPKKKKWWVLFVIMVLLCLLGAAGYYYRTIIVPSQNMVPPSAIQSPALVVRIDTIDEVITDTVSQVVVPVDTVAAPTLTLENYTYKDALNAPVREIVTVIDGSRLTMVSYRAFGHKAFWVYVYDANRKVLSSPNSVEKGMQLVIPDLPMSIVDPNNPACLEKAYELAKKY